MPTESHDSNKPQKADCPSASCSAWVISHDGENYSSASFTTKEEAISEGLALYEGEPFYVGELEEPTPPEDSFNCDDWLEHVSCQEDYEGDHADGWDISTKEQREELNKEVRAVMAAWLDRYKLRPTFYNVPNGEYIEPNVQSPPTGGKEA